MYTLNIHSVYSVLVDFVIYCMVQDMYNEVSIIIFLLNAMDNVMAR